MFETIEKITAYFAKITMKEALYKLAVLYYGWVAVILIVMAFKGKLW